MRNAQNIHICNDEVMIHVLDPKNNKPPFLSTRPNSLLDDNDLAEFFLGHITNGLKDSTSKSAKFLHNDNDKPSGLCSGLLNQTIDLITGSQQLANCLNEVMDNNHVIASGDLVVCYFEAENYPNTRFLALFKVDPSKTLLREPLLDEEGHAYVDLRVKPNALPTTKERLQKCVFIRPHEPEDPDFDMLLLDRQTSKSNDNGIAKFFIEDFLDAEYSLNATQRTEKLYKALIASQNIIKNRLTQEERMDLDTRIRSAVTAQFINIDLWIEQLPLSDEIKQAFNQEIQKVLIDREFELDREKGAEFTRRRIFKGEYNLKLSIDATGYERMVTDEGIITNDPSRPPYHRIVIETEKWDEIPYHS
jgi:nucleoid-associated protein YejK